MSRIARSDLPLFQTRGRPVSFPVRLTAPSGAAIDLTGASATGVFKWDGASQPLDIAYPSRVGGRMLATGNATISQKMPVGHMSEFRLSVTDSQGEFTEYVWPVIGEDP